MCKGVIKKFLGIRYGSKDVTNVTYKLLPKYIKVVVDFDSNEIINEEALNDELYKNVGNKFGLYFPGSIVVRPYDSSYGQGDHGRAYYRCCKFYIRYYLKIQENKQYLLKNDSSLIDSELVDNDSTGLIKNLQEFFQVNENNKKRTTVLTFLDKELSPLRGGRKSRRRYKRTKRVLSKRKKSRRSTRRLK